MGSSFLTGDWTRAPALGAQSLSRWTTGEVPLAYSLWVYFSSYWNTSFSSSYSQAVSVGSSPSLDVKMALFCFLVLAGWHLASISPCCLGKAVATLLRAQEKASLITLPGRERVYPLRAVWSGEVLFLLILFCIGCGLCIDLLSGFFCFF